MSWAISRDFLEEAAPEPDLGAQERVGLVEAVGRHGATSAGFRQTWGSKSRQAVSRLCAWHGVASATAVQ